ncbi:agglutinin biogenesis protein MshP [Herminiimonas arsenitoxidans]|uniref:agglutinin biogenesis protein MshP n=1 Tax=Herminiimonas arsenitoxidans TaxID=1809410 RepID=UPI001E601DA2|nr:agglutinin biogenesis protein MshP [Herminiimonas arsenitoxidans]
MIFQRSGYDIRGVRMCKAGGFSLVSAIFLLVVLAALGVAMVTISTVQHQSSGLDVQGTRAYQAARAGAEWGIYQRMQVPAYCGAAVANNIALPAGTSLNGFTVTVVCTPDNGLGLNINSAVIEATACNIPAGGTCPNAAPNSSDYVQRVVQVRL